MVRSKLSVSDDIVHITSWFFNLPNLDNRQIADYHIHVDLQR